MSLPRTLPTLASLLALTLTMSASASGPTFWTVATAADFLKGTSDGVYVSLGGTVTAGPPLTNRLSSTPAQIWSIAQTTDGTIWAGTGTDGRLIRIRPGQNAEETVFDSPEANIFAVAATGTRVYAASSPDGKVYVMDGSAEPRVFFDPQEKYIWSLATDASGRLWVGAGNPAVLYRVNPDGTHQIIYRPPATHIVTLAVDQNGRMLAGTESPGRLYRFDANDRPFVMLETGLAELRAVDVGADGVVFAAGVAKGDETSSDGETTSIAVTLSSATPASGATPATAPPSPRRSVLYRIDATGTWEEIWTTGDVIYDLAAQNDGAVLVATGPEGRLYRVDRTLDVNLFTGVDARQITRFAPTVSSAPISAFATANPGRVVSLGTGTQSPARYVSSVRDTKSVATWGLIRWEATGPLTFSTRSGNTQQPDDSWSDWSAPYKVPSGEMVTSPAARFMQWRAEFTQSAGGPAPSLTAVTLAYLPRNNRPVVSTVTVHPPGLVFQRPFVNDESAIAGLDEMSIEARRPPGDTGPTVPAPGRRMFQKGLQTIGWKAEDEDDDQLVYTLQYRREDQSEWRDLKTNATGSMYVWDTSTVPDGRYFIRVRASDAPSNAAERALIGDREGDPVDVDNTPPSLEIAITAQASGARVNVRVRDLRSAIEKVEYAVSGGPWQLTYPVDGLADSPDERFEIVLPANTNPSDVVIRAVDLLQNVVSQPAAAR